MRQVVNQTDCLIQLDTRIADSPRRDYHRRIETFRAASRAETETIQTRHNHKVIENMNQTVIERRLQKLVSCLPFR